MATKTANRSKTVVVVGVFAAMYIAAFGLPFLPSGWTESLRALGWIGLIGYLAGLCYAVWRVQSGSRPLDLVVADWMGGLVGWALLPSFFAVAFADQESTRDLWATAWYWSLRPIPLEIAGITNWEPAVAETWWLQSFFLLSFQALTVILVLGGLALVVRRWRADQQRRTGK